MRSSTQRTLGGWRIRPGATVAPMKSDTGAVTVRGLEQQRRERGEAVPPRGGWHQYSIPIDPDEAYRLQYQARRDGHINEDRYWARYREGLQHGPQR